MLLNKIGFTLSVSLVCTGVSSTSHAESLKFLNSNGSTKVFLKYDLDGINYEGTTAGSYQFLLNGNSKEQGFCTDIANSIYNGESWTVTMTDVGNSKNGLASTWYEKDVNVANGNINAIDYITSKYLGTQNSAAAQLAIWDLSLNGGVVHNRYGYHWSNSFAEDGVSISKVYNIEQIGLANDGKSWGSVFANAGLNSCNRPQDIAFAPNSVLSGPPPVPEASSVFGMSGLLAAGGISMFKRRK